MLIQIKVIYSVHRVLDGDLNVGLDLLQKQAVKLSMRFINYTLCMRFLFFAGFFFWFPYFKTPPKSAIEYTKYFTSIFCEHISTDFCNKKT